MNEPIFVTQPFLPPLHDLIPLLQEIWNNKQLTNNGPLHRELESRLCSFLDVDNISLFANGTIALLAALRSLRISGEVITTPFSFVATSHSLLWNNITPVFVDIDPKTFNLDPRKIEGAITGKTSAILPVHCYGYACDADFIQRIASEYGLKVIYDAAHAFGVQCDCGSILKHGDLSVLSFHATKVFNTFEGGAIICKDKSMKESIDRIKNFGFSGETRVVATGINGKMNELQAAVGLIQLNHFHEAINARRRIDTIYRDHIKSIKGLTCPSPNSLAHNYSYFPLIVNSDYHLSRDELYDRFRLNNIYSRRYFYPLISDFPMYRNLPGSNPENLPIATDIANKILCLPIYPSLTDHDIHRIVSILSF